MDESAIFTTSIQALIAKSSIIPESQREMPEIGRGVQYFSSPSLLGQKSPFLMQTGNACNEVKNNSTKITFLPKKRLS